MAQFTLPDLPFDPKSLEPNLSAETFSYHHGKHHKAYVDMLNKLITEQHQKFESLSLEEVIKESHAQKIAPIFNNSAQIWNHTFYWDSMTPNFKDPSNALAKKIDKDFGGLDALKSELKTAATTQFGSGWAWLVVDKKTGKLEVSKTPNAETPLTDESKKPVLTIDVWEHAYYIDYRNKRPDYVDTFLNKIVNWEFAAENAKEYL